MTQQSCLGPIDRIRARSACLVLGIGSNCDDAKTKGLQDLSAFANRSLRSRLRRDSLRRRPAWPKLANRSLDVELPEAALPKLTRVFLAGVSEGWLGDRDSNPDNLLQRQVSYR